MPRGFYMPNPKPKCRLYYNGHKLRHFYAHYDIHSVGYHILDR